MRLALRWCLVECTRIRMLYANTDFLICGSCFARERCKRVGNGLGVVSGCAVAVVALFVVSLWTSAASVLNGPFLVPPNKTKRRNKKIVALYFATGQRWFVILGAAKPQPQQQQQQRSPAQSTIVVEQAAEFVSRVREVRQAKRWSCVEAS